MNGRARARPFTFLSHWLSPMFTSRNGELATILPPMRTLGTKGVAMKRWSGIVVAAVAVASLLALLPSSAAAKGGGQLQSFGVDRHFQSLGRQEESSREPAARRKREGDAGARRWSKRHQTS